ncbi:putative Ankyrin repeat domain-containing protein, partial [Naja naja]
MEVWMEGE